MPFRKAIFLIIGLLFFFTIKAQDSASEKNACLKEKLDSIAIIDYPGVLYRDYGLPFIQWKERPQSFSFTIFDRWGRIFDFSFNPDYVLDADNFENRIPEGTNLFYQVEIIRPSGEKIRFNRIITYVGYYRCG